MRTLGHSILIIAYHVLTHHAPYDDTLLRHARTPRPPLPDRLVLQLQNLGYTVSLQPIPLGA